MNDSIDDMIRDSDSPKEFVKLDYNTHFESDRIKSIKISSICHTTSRELAKDISYMELMHMNDNRPWWQLPLGLGLLSLETYIRNRKKN